MRLDEKKVWEIIDLIISENVDTSEAIKAYDNGGIQLDYSSIVNNRLNQSRVNLDMKTIKLMSIPTMRIFTVEAINYLRGIANT